MAIETTTTVPAGNNNIPANEDQIIEDIQGQKITTGAVDNQEVEDQDVILSENLEDAKEEVGTASNDLMSFLEDFGLMSTEGNPDASAFDQLRELLLKLESALITLKSAYAEASTQAAISGFEISLAGIDDMLKQADMAMAMAIVSGAVNVVAQGGAAAAGTAIMIRSSKLGSASFQNQGVYTNMQIQSQLVNAAAGSISGSSKVFDGIGQQASAEGQAAQKEADTEAQLLQTIREAMEEMRKVLQDISDKLEQARAGTNQVDTAFKTRA